MELPPARDPIPWAEDELARVGVVIHDGGRGVYRCLACGTTWTPEDDGSARLPLGWWVCPFGCNAPRSSR